jgi:hypothetical protein
MFLFVDLLDNSFCAPSCANVMLTHTALCGVRWCGNHDLQQNRATEGATHDIAAWQHGNMATSEGTLLQPVGICIGAPPGGWKEVRNLALVKINHGNHRLQSRNSIGRRCGPPTTGLTSLDIAVVAMEQAQSVASHGGQIPDKGSGSRLAGGV